LNFEQKVLILSEEEDHRCPHGMSLSRNMPKMNGHELFSALLKKYPKLKVLYMSGYTNNMVNSNQILDEGVQFIQKPFNVQALALKVREALNR
jgi:DNA-binding NtrC family response regulator